MKFDELVYFTLSGKVLKRIKCTRHTFTMYHIYAYTYNRVFYNAKQTPEVIFLWNASLFSSISVREIRALEFFNLNFMII